MDSVDHDHKDAMLNSRTRPFRSVLVGVLVGVSISLAGWKIRSVLAEGIPSPNPLYYSGTLTEAGTLVNDAARSIKVNLWTNPTPTTGENAFCTTSVTTPVINGRFRVALDSTCKGGINSNQNVFVEVVENGTTLPRAKIGAVPYAVEADHAVNATNAANAIDGGGISSALSSVAAVTAWTSYAPTVTSSGTGATISNFISTGTWRRVGDTAEVTIVSRVTGVPSGPSGEFWAWGLPAVQIDYSKLAGGEGVALLGSAFVYAATGGANECEVVGWGLNRLEVGCQGFGASVSSGVPNGWPSGQAMSIRVSFPVVGWSIN